MSIEVVKEAIAYTIDCPFCKSVLKFHREDIKYREDIEYTYPYGNAVKCPVCEKTIKVSDIDGELNTMVEPIFDKGVNVIGKYDPHMNTMLFGDKEE